MMLACAFMLLAMRVASVCTWARHVTKDMQVVQCMRVPTESRSLTRACRMDDAYCPCDAHPQGSVGTLCRLGYAVLQSLHLCTLWGHMCLSYFGNVF